MGKKSSKQPKNSKSDLISEKEVAKKEAKFNFDFNLVKKAYPVLIVILLLGFVMWFAFFVRSGPINLNGLEENVRSNTYAQVQNIISQQVDSQYPNLNAAYKQELVQKEYQKVLDTGIFEIQGQKIVIEDVVKQNSITLKDAFKADNGQTYLTEMDSHNFLHYSTNFYKYGHTGDALVDGKPWVTNKVSPEGYPGTYTPDLLVWLEAKLYAFNNLDKENSTDEQRTAAIYLLSVILVMLSAIPIYFIIRKFSNDLFAFFGSLVLVTIGTYVSRTVVGFVDTDAFNVLFPGLIVLFLIYAFVYKEILVKILFTMLSGLFLGLYMWAWSAGWFIFVFLVLSLLTYLGYIIISHFIVKEKEFTFFNKIKNDLIVLVSFSLSSVLFTYIIIKENIFTYAYNGLFGSLSEIASISTSNIWPNVLSSVAELNPASFSQIVLSVGGNIIFIIAMLGILFLSLDYTAKNNKFSLFNKLLIFFSIIWFIAIVNSGLFQNLTINEPKLFVVLLFLPIGIALISSLFNKVEDSKVFLTILLSVWAAGTIYMSFSGVRFILLLAPAFCVAFGLGMFYISKIINNFASEEFDVKHPIKQLIPGFIFTAILFLILFVPMATQANAISKGTTPTFDDVWYNSMYKIKNESNPNAIITSWWDFGHFYSAISNRGSTFDGGSQSLPKAHWVGRLLMENDEEVSHDILQMLVCGGDEAHKIMLNYTTDKSTADAVKVNKIIYSTFGKSQDEKIQILKTNKYYKFDDSQVELIMHNLACETPRENYLITSEDMIGKAGVWAHWGSWDFTKKYVYDNYQSKTVEQISTDIDENTTLIQTYVDELKAIDKKSVQENIKRDDLINQWLAPYPSYIPIQNQYEYACQNQNTTLVCQNGIVIDMMTGKINSSFGKDVKFANLVYPTNEGKVNVVSQGQGDIDVVLIPSSTGFNVMLAQHPLGNSLFTKLYFMDGYGTTKFEKFDEQQSVTGVRFSIWKVNWSDLNETNSKNLSIN